MNEKWQVWNLFDKCVIHHSHSLSQAYMPMLHAAGVHITPSNAYHSHQLRDELPHPTPFLTPTLSATLRWCVRWSWISTGFVPPYMVMIAATMWLQYYGVWLIDWWIAWLLQKVNEYDGRIFDDIWTCTRWTDRWIHIHEKKKFDEDNKIHAARVIGKVSVDFFKGKQNRLRLADSENLKVFLRLIVGQASLNIQCLKFHSVEAEPGLAYPSHQSGIILYSVGLYSRVLLWGPPFPCPYILAPPNFSTKQFISIWVISPSLKYSICESYIMGTYLTSPLYIGTSVLYY